ncbi:hydroxylamine oxidoreductase [Pseudodesulfovibrio cashew]|uniref:Hydroxylamine oxidoreductase n=1 Tax=Pseudodesulfovibrio cashew TaxID=2678688 RepID=A0A6I6JD41_9BACT|nr:multiheme c-type cytochrome [Pseudodesulfovibrio cashew]QGY40031.1 hydroxylamine oxidoreductase [Pseudodesulfovibrio cashew]
MKRVLFLFCCGVILLAVPAMAQNMPKMKEFRIERGMSEQAKACINCHKAENPGLFADWTMSRHASANITCLDCHQADPADKDVIKEHFKQYERSDTQWGRPEYKVPIATAVTPKDCSRCHPDEVKQYARSKHANTNSIVWKIDPWMRKGMNNAAERQSGCLTCHGTALKLDDKGNLDAATWPNVGVGRINMDGSFGSCTSCHTRHRFSVAEARRPQACGQCHLGPDHPQIEIFTESKHGAIYDSFGESYNWDAAPGTWTAGVDYRGPTCASCHMSGTGPVMTTHDVTERLSWELQAPLTVRPQDFKPLPAQNDWKVERDKMKAVCTQCHTNTWVDNHYVKLDKVVANYNDIYFKPAKAMLDELYAKGLITKEGFFDERPEVEFYELWHHEGRRARMGAAMMAPDYAWWHGFYECKHRFNHFREMVEEHLKSGEKFPLWQPYPGSGGDTTPPAALNLQ